MAWYINQRGRTLHHNGREYGFGDVIPAECAESMRPFVAEKPEPKTEDTEEEIVISRPSAQIPQRRRKR